MAINRKTGKLARPNEKNPFMESFVEGTEPGIAMEEVESNDQGIVDTILEDEDYYEVQ